MKWTPQKTITVGVGGGGLAREAERVADVVGHVLDLGHLVVVREDDGVALARERPDLVRACSMCLRSWSSNLHGDVEGARAVCQRADRDEVDAGLGDGADGVERDAAGGLELRAAGDERDRLAQLVGRSCCRAGSTSAPASSASRTCVERVALDLDRQARRPCARRDGVGDAAGDPQVVVLDQHRVVEPEAVVACRRRTRTARFSSARSPGVVLRVSRISRRCPSTAST